MKLISIPLILLASIALAQNPNPGVVVVDSSFGHQVRVEADVRDANGSLVPNQSKVLNFGPFEDSYTGQQTNKTHINSTGFQALYRSALGGDLVADPFAQSTTTVDGFAIKAFMLKGIYARNFVVGGQHDAIAKAFAWSTVRQKYHVDTPVGEQIRWVIPVKMKLELLNIGCTGIDAEDEASAEIHLWADYDSYAIARYNETLNAWDIEYKRIKADGTPEQDETVRFVPSPGQQSQTFEITTYPLYNRGDYFEHHIDFNDPEYWIQLHGIDFTNSGGIDESWAMRTDTKIEVDTQSIVPAILLGR